MLIRIIIPSQGSAKRQAERQYLLRRHDIDFTALVEAALKLWEERSELDPLERNERIIRLFQRFVDDTLTYERVQKLASLIDKTLAALQDDLSAILDPYLEILFPGRTVKLQLAPTQMKDFVVEAIIDESQDESLPPLENHLSDRGVV